MAIKRDSRTMKLAAAVLAFVTVFVAVRAIGDSSAGGAGSGIDSVVHRGQLPSATTVERIRGLEAQVRQSPSDPQSHVSLGHAYLTRFGETEDPTLYPMAQHAFETALSLDSNDASAVAGLAQLELSKHRFRQGLALAKRARALNPSTVQIDGLIIDGQIELGRYRAAARTLEHYVDRRPELGSYARISYFRELHGDVAGAVSAMQLAASAAGDGSANSAYATTLLGKLSADQGDYRAAEARFRQVLELKPGYPDAMLGLAAIEFASGHIDTALDRYRAAQRTVAAPDHAILLGEAEEAAGDPAAASHAYGAARAAFDQLEAEGANTATERAVFEAGHGDPARAVELGRRAWRYTPSVRAADAYSWALSAAGYDRAALRFSDRAMRLGSVEPIFLYHAGIVALRAGRHERARRFLHRLVAQSPNFNPLLGPRAQRALSASA